MARKTGPEIAMTGRDAFIIAPQALADQLDASDIRIVDASWYLPAHMRDGKAEYLAARIPGAVYFDIDKISDTASPLPHMLPSPENFVNSVGALGISENDDIVVYDGPGLFSCARAWWMFRVMGASRVRILDGGIDNWRNAGLPVETGPAASPKPAVFNADFDASRVKAIAEIRANVKSGAALVLDARPFGRFAGTVSEPRPGLRSGHIPGSRSLPAIELVRDGRLKGDEELRELLSETGLRDGQEAITSCGSGVTAAVISLALEVVGHRPHALYDGSWSEWGQADNAPVAQWAEKQD
jgi:thiosulfate/3-mercaptopyruvate sulfurtransferase